MKGNNKIGREPLKRMRLKCYIGKIVMILNLKVILSHVKYNFE